MRACVQYLHRLLPGRFLRYLRHRLLLLVRLLHQLRRQFGLRVCDQRRRLVDQPPRACTLQDRANIY